jgi:hypothetical protein
LARAWRTAASWASFAVEVEALELVAELEVEVPMLAEDIVPWL